MVANAPTAARDTWQAALVVVDRLLIDLGHPSSRAIWKAPFPLREIRELSEGLPEDAATDAGPWSARDCRS